ncbi:MAG: GNAT family N-acetyltransferase [Candidatus Paceibacteria bacterium]
MLRLVLPSKKYIKGNIDYLKELYRKRELSKKELDDKIEERKNASAFFKKLKDNKNGINLEKGKVAHTVYWLVANKKYIGTLSLRKKLNKKLRIRGGNIGYAIRPSERKKGYGTEILRLGLLKARTQGFKRIRIDCRENNPASRKIIEANGGVFIEKTNIKGQGLQSLRYYIDIG